MKTKNILDYCDDFHFKKSDPWGPLLCRDQSSDIPPLETRVDVDDRHICRATVEHAEQCCDSAK